MNVEPIILKILSAGVGLVIGIIAAIIIRSRAVNSRIRLITLLALPVLGGAAGYSLSSDTNLPALIQEKLLTNNLRNKNTDGAASAPGSPSAHPTSQQTPKDISPEALRTKIDAAIAQLDDPFFAAVLKREPRRASDSYERFEAAYIRGGAQALQQAIEETVQHVAERAMPRYLARAQENDLLTTSALLRDIMKDLTITAPEICYLWLYGASTGRTFRYDRFVAAIGKTRHKTLQQSLANAVRNASDFLPEYDEDYAFQKMGEIGEEIYHLLGDQRIGIIQAGQEPQSVEEMKLACHASSIIYDYVLDDERPVVLLQHMFSGADAFAANY